MNADGNSTPTENSPTQPTRGRRRAVRWRWYHFYFILAMFDLVVIMASLTLYHRTLTSYSIALSSLGRIDEEQSWVANLRLAVVKLNAPGNDVFQTRQVRREHLRFEQTRTRYRALLLREDEFGIDLGEFRGQVQRMCEEEEQIFQIFESVMGNGPGELEGPIKLDVATSHMASMDRHQAHALESLAAVAQVLSSEQHGLLDGYGADLQRSAAIEKFLLGTVLLILAGVFWYGRKLQQTYEQMIAEQQLAIEEKHARLAAVGEVCSAVAHGIRNPLAAITSSAQLAIEFGTLDETTRMRVEDVLYESRRLDERITRMLDFSTVKVHAFEPCDLGEIITEAIHEIQPKLDQHNVRVETTYPPTPLIVDGDREWLAQAIIEVVSNSMEHLPSGGNVRLECRRDRQDPRYARIDIIDDGPGIPESIRPHVFNLFFTSKAEGNGIGLASVKRAVEMHGGRVGIANTNSGGAHIEIQLPLASRP